MPPTALQGSLPLFDDIAAIPPLSEQSAAPPNHTEVSKPKREPYSHQVQNLILYAENTQAFYKKAMSIYAAFTPTGSREKDIASLSPLFRSFMADAIAAYQREMDESPGVFTQKEKDSFCEYYAEGYFDHDVQTELQRGQIHVVKTLPADISAFAGGKRNVKMVDSAIVALLSRATTKDNAIFINTGELDRPTYEKVNAVLSKMGGKWNKSKRAHVFPFDPSEKLDLLLMAGVVEVPENYGFFPTPPDLAERIIRLADIRPGHIVLEPQAGTGNLADPAARIVGVSNVVCCELQEANRAILAGKGYKLIGEDFLALAPEQIYPRIVLNPPFARFADVAHVSHAIRFLAPGGRLTGIMSGGILFREERRIKDFRQMIADMGGDIEENPKGSFRESGTECGTVSVVVEAPL